MKDSRKWQILIYICEGSGRQGFKGEVGQGVKTMYAGTCGKRVQLRAGTRCDDEVGPSAGLLLLEKTKRLLKAKRKVYFRGEGCALQMVQSWSSSLRKDSIRDT